jgi:hypothetical protein
MSTVATRPESAPIPAEADVAEQRFFRTLMRGALIGIPICVVIWVGMVALALSMAEGDWDTLAVLGAGALIGVIAGLFLGGCIAATIAAVGLDHNEDDD